MTAKKKSPEITRESIISSYMDHVLEKERFPVSIYKFCQEHSITEKEFYQHFGSFDGLKKSIWIAFFEKTMELLHINKEYSSFSPKDKLLSFYFSFFELLTLNRSYVLFTLSEHMPMIKNLGQLKGLRVNFKDFARNLIEEGNNGKTYKINQRHPGLFSEAAWLQLMFLLKFWFDDSSPGLEKTDIAIEKSVQTAFDVFENTPVDSILDFGKFLYKERMA